MPRLDEIVAYIYQANIYCPDCVINAMTGDEPGPLDDTETLLDNLAASEGFDRNDESEFDSDFFPKVVIRQMIEGHEHCGTCGGVIE